MSTAWRDLLPGDRDIRPDTRAVVYWAMVLNAEFLLVAGYYLLSPDVTLRNPLFAAVPFVWINLGAWAVRRTDAPPAPAHEKRLAFALAVGYFLVLAVFGGIINGPSVATGTTFTLFDLPPGWNPALYYNSPAFSLVLLPYTVVGYSVLAYLVYVTALDAANVLVGGVLGVFSCVSCTFPIVVGALSGLLGGGSAVAGFALANSYFLSTAIFAVTVLLLTWRPSFGG